MGFLGLGSLLEESSSQNMSGVGKATTLVPRSFELVAYLIKYGNADLESTAAGG